MLFALLCTDKKDHLSVRMDNRPAHVEFLNGLGDALKGAGPFLDADEKPNGSLVIIEADDRAAAEAIAAADPYAKAGLFQSVEIRPWAWLLKNPETQ
ncbi:MAG: YciI-like protein [Devosiaceae bacterium]